VMASSREAKRAVPPARRTAAVEKRMSARFIRGTSLLPMICARAAAPGMAEVTVAVLTAFGGRL
jgi:hypothetical protein